MELSAVERIEQMETILNAAREKLDALECARAELIAFQEEIHKLEAYYTGAAWKKDLALEEARRLPADLKRGVLSEDGIYNILEHNREWMDVFSGDETE